MSGIAAAAALFCAGCGEKESPVTPTDTEYTLTATPSPADGGSVSINPEKNTYTADDVVTVTAAAAEGYTFKEWSGASTSTDTSLTITMNGNKTLRANFEQKAIAIYTLTTNANPLSGGNVFRNPDEEIYTDGKQVTVTAMAVAGYRFTGWSGASTATTSPVIITMNDNITLTANFEQQTYTLTLEVDSTSGGSVSSNLNKVSYTYGDVVTVTAEAKENYKFTGWSGASVSKDAAITVTMDGDKILTAHFKLKTYTLTTRALPTEGGEVIRYPDKPEYAYNEKITVMAAANSGYRFTGWIGLEDTTDTVTFKMGNSDMTLGAIFEEKIETMP